MVALALAAHAPLVRELYLGCTGPDPVPEAVWRSLGVAAALSATLAAACGRVRWWLPLLGVAALLGPAEAFYISRFGLPSGPHLYGVIAETDWQETQALLGAWLWPMAAALVAAVTIASTGLRWIWRPDWQWRHRSRWWVLCAVAALGGVVAWGEQLVAVSEARAGLPEERARATSYLARTMPAEATGFFGDLEASFPWGLPLRMHRFLKHRQMLAEHLQQRRTFMFHPHAIAPGNDEPQVHVLVIGETARADRWGLFGYNKDTTPELDRRNHDGELAAFRDAVSAAAATRESVPLMLTRRPGNAPLTPTLEPSVLTAFAQSGYKTYWFSAQGMAGSHETPISVLASEADVQRFINQVDFRGQGALDGDLLPLLTEALAEPAPRKFIVLHTLGSHLNYAHRYPSAFERFKPAMQPEDTPEVWRRTRLEVLNNAYDNSVLYTDHVLSAVIGLVERTGGVATVTYAGDHGEVLFDGNCRQGGHGFAAIANYHIPIFIWASAPWREQHADAWQRLMARRAAPITTLAMFPTLTQLASFDANLADGPRALSSPDWTRFPRAVTHYGDFDRDVRTQGCDAPAPGRAASRP